MKTSRCVALVSLGTPVMVGMIAASLVLTGPASSKPAEPHADRAAVLQALTDCRKITEDTARLACYDKAAGAFDQAESQGQVVVIDKEQVKAVRRQAFGFNLPTLRIFDRTTKNEEGMDRVDLEVANANHDPEGHWVFTATNGAVWRQTDSQMIPNDPHAGSKLLVKSGVLGAFFCKVDGQLQVRCQRVS